jgi:hypothetical protein
MDFKAFKNNVNLMISQSNEYCELCESFQEVCQKYKLGRAGQSVFKVVLCELEKRLEAEQVKSEVNFMGFAPGYKG